MRRDQKKTTVTFRPPAACRRLLPAVRRARTSIASEASALWSEGHVHRLLPHLEPAPKSGLEARAIAAKMRPSQ